MADGVGLSVGATNLAAVVVARTAVTRSSVVTLFGHRPTEVGVPSQNPNLNERGLIITDFVDRVGDPVDIVASDGSAHRAESVLADALRSMLYALGRGRPFADPVGVTYPAHWGPTAVDALRGALADVAEFQSPKQAAVVSDAAAALTALHDDPGLPTRGVVALCDFGGSGTSVTFANAANGFQPIRPTVRHTDFSGHLIDQALLTHVINDLTAAGTIDLSGTSAIGSLSRLRGQCRGAKEWLSTTAVTTLSAELPGHRGEVRLTRAELDEAIRAPLADFVGLITGTLEDLERNGIRDLVAVATVGGGARIPIITTTLSERFRVPVITTAQPELTAAIGAGLTAVRGTFREGPTIAAGAPAAAAGAATELAPEAAPALAWSEADDIPDVVPTDPYDYDGAATGDGVPGPRPQMQFDHEAHEEQAAPPPWYRRPAAAVGAGVFVLLAALAVAVMFVMRDDDTPSPASTTVSSVPSTTTTATTTAVPPPAAPAPAPETQAPETRTVTQEAPPPPVTVTEAPPPPATSEEPPPVTPEPTPEPTPAPTTEPTTEPAPPPPFTLPPITLFPGGPTIPIGPQPPP